MKRRELLSAIGATSVGCASGCLGFFDSTDLVGIVIVNHSDSQQTVQVRVEQDGDAVEEATHTLDANTSEFLDCTWTGDAGNFVVSGRLDGEDEWTELDGDDSDTECAYVYVNVNPATSLIDFAISDDCDHDEAC